MYGRYLGNSSKNYENVIDLILEKYGRGFIHMYSNDIPATLYICIMKKKSRKLISRFFTELFKEYDFKIIEISDLDCISKKLKNYKRFRDAEIFKKDYDSFIEEIVEDFKSKRCPKYEKLLKDSEIFYYIDNVGVEILMDFGNLVININFIWRE